MLDAIFTGLAFGMPDVLSGKFFNSNHVLSFGDSTSSVMGFGTRNIIMGVAPNVNVSVDLLSPFFTKQPSTVSVPWKFLRGLFGLDGLANLNVGAMDNLNYGGVDSTFTRKANAAITKHYSGSGEEDKYPAALKATMTLGLLAIFSVNLATKLMFPNDSAENTKNYNKDLRYILLSGVYSFATPRFIQLLITLEKTYAAQAVADTSPEKILDIQKILKEKLKENEETVKAVIAAEQNRIDGSIFVNQALEDEKNRIETQFNAVKAAANKQVDYLNSMLGTTKNGGRQWAENDADMYTSFKSYSLTTKSSLSFESKDKRNRSKMTFDQNGILLESDRSINLSPNGGVKISSTGGSLDFGFPANGGNLNHFVISSQNNSMNLQVGDESRGPSFIMNGANNQITLSHGTPDAGRCLEITDSNLTVRGGRVDNSGRVIASSSKVVIAVGRDQLEYSRGGLIQIEGDQGITIQVGNSSIKVKADEVSLNCAGSCIKVKNSGVTIEGANFVTNSELEKKVKELLHNAEATIINNNKVQLHLFGK